MTLFEDLPQMLGIVGPVVEKNGALWLDASALGLRELAKQMNTVGARFVTITAYQLPGDTGYRLEYHWDLEGRLMGFPFSISGKAIDSIYDLCEAADWIEREIHEEFALDFVGRAYEPLLLRQGDTAGVNLREEVV